MLSNCFLCQVGGTHVIQAFFSDDISEEIQIQGRTARQGNQGTYSLILTESEIVELGLDQTTLEDLQGMQPKQRYDLLYQQRKRKQAQRSQEMKENLQKANALDKYSEAHLYGLLQGPSPSANEKLIGLYKQITQQQTTKSDGSGPSSGYHVVACYDESGSMALPVCPSAFPLGFMKGSLDGSKWASLRDAHRTFMTKMKDMPDVKVSVVQFARTARRVLQLADAAEAATMLLELRSSGPTNFEPALTEAMRLMEEGQIQWPKLTPVLLFMSDGLNDDGDCKQAIRTMQQRFPSLSFHAVIFGQKDSKQLRDMTEVASDGNFHASVDEVSLIQTFRAIAQGLEYTGR